MVNRKYIVAGCSLLLSLPLIPAVAQQKQNATQKPGRFTLENIGPFQVAWDEATGGVRNGVTSIVFIGGPNGKVRATTARYDLIAPRIAMTFARNSVPATAEATGGVNGEARDPARQQVIAFRSDKATYRTAGGADPSRIDLNGNVRVIFRSLEFSETAPLTLNCESGQLLFQPDGGVDFKLLRGDGSGTLLESPPKKKP